VNTLRTSLFGTIIEDWIGERGEMASANGPNWLMTAQTFKRRNKQNDHERTHPKNEAGRTLLRQLHEWIVAEVAEYNEVLGEEELVVVLLKADTAPGIFFDCVSVSSKDGTKGPLRISYSCVPGSIVYWYEGRRVDLPVRITDGGHAQIATLDHVAKCREEIGQKMLSQLRHPQLKPIHSWAKGGAG
jgi:hypothetical protein